MLEKFIKKNNFDAHFHYSECKILGICDFPKGFCGISCADSEDAWNVQFAEISKKTTEREIFLAYGLHPQSAKNENVKKSVDFLEKLILERKISFIGEIGFDFFSDEYKKFAEKQEEIFNLQLDLALNHNLPVIIHCRKANHKLFEYADKLSKLPETLFHSFMGTSIEAKSLLNRKINGYFSFGKQIFNGNKKVVDCVKNLPADRVFAETDAPYQFLKGEKFTKPSEITKIYAEIARLQENSKS